MIDDRTRWKDDTEPPTNTSPAYESLQKIPIFHSEPREIECRPSSGLAPDIWWFFSLALFVLSFVRSFAHLFVRSLLLSFFLSFVRSLIVFGATRGVTVSMSAFLACHQCYCAGSSLAWGLNLRAVVCGIFWSSSPGVFSGYSGFLPSFIGLMIRPIK